MRHLGQDMRHGARILWKNRGFSAVALLALTLGMGASTAIFSVVNTVLLEPLPFLDPERLLILWEKNPVLNKYKMSAAPVNLMAWQAQSRTLEGMAGIHDVNITLTGGPNGHIDPEELKVERVSAGLFPLLGVQAVVGRVFRPEEDQPGRATAALLSYSLWQRRFGADPAIGGKSIRLRDQVYTVAGVLPARFAVLEPGVDVWIPLGLNPADTRVANGRFLTVIGRMRRGLELAEVRREMEAIGARTEQATPALNQGWRPSLFVLTEELVGNVSQALWVLTAAVGCLLLMACVNVANLLLARGSTRRKEIALRAALGAGRGRLIAQLLSESLILALAGGVLGLLVAAAAVALVASAGPADVPRLAQVGLNGRVFGFSLGIAVLTGLLFGAAPALQGSSVDLRAVLNEGGRGGTAGRAGRITRQALVVAQVAMAIVILIGAGLLIRSFLRLRAVNPGFDSAHVLTLRTPLGGGRNTAPERRAAFMQQVTSRIAALPGVRDAAAVSALPFTGLGLGAAFRDEAQPAPPPGQGHLGLMRSVTPSYFKTMGIPLVAGRMFTDADQPQSPAVLIVNQTLAHRLWPTGSAIGARLALDAYNTRSGEIVGIVGDVKPERMQSDEWPTIYNPYAQTRVTTMVVVARTAGPPLAQRAAAERVIHELDPDQVVADVRGMDEIVGQSMEGARFNTLVFGIFAAIAFVLAAVGIYGVIAYDVGERTNEIGIRMAMGAQPADVLKLVVGQGAMLAGIGIVIGLGAAFWVTRLMSALLFGITPTDPVTFAAISILLAAVALAASYLPARRAMALDPVAALRHD